MNRDGDGGLLRSASYAITVGGFPSGIVGVRVEMTSGPSPSTWKVFSPVGHIDVSDLSVRLN